MKIKRLLYLLITLLFIVIFYTACNSNKVEEEIPLTAYSIKNAKIYYNTTPIQFVGANAFHSFGGDSNDMNSWNIDIVREFVGNMKENPLSGEVIQDANGSYLHSLQSIVDANTINNKVTILCPFRWNGNTTTDFTGKMPTNTFWYNDYKLKLQQWANEFKNQPNVWIEVWNEPFIYDRTDGYTDEIWLSIMNEMVAIIRNAGNNNIILVPCAEQGQDESVLINKGTVFLQGKTNILFDIHAYEKWLLADNTSQRLANLNQHNIPYFFGEIAPVNAGELMNPQPFLEQLYSQGTSVCAWAWKYDQNDQDALLTSSGLPNDIDNNNWGTIFKEISGRIRNP